MSEFVSLLSQHSWLFIALVAVVSLLIGSFLNVLVYRLPKMMEREWQQEYQAYFQADAVVSATDSGKAAGAANKVNASALGTPERFNLAVPRSACPKCHTPIAARDNIPVLSWLLLKGRCRHCKAPISSRYPAVEALTAVMSGLVAWQYGFGTLALVLIFVTWGLIALSFIDIDTMLLPDSLTLPLLWLALVFSLTDSALVNPGQAIIGAAAGYLTLWLVYWGFKLLTGKEGMGYGDFKLLAIFGALLGWQQLPLIILLSSLVGAVIGASMLAIQGRDKATPIPFGPYIAAAGFIALLWGEQLTNAYLSYLGA
ncbi:prepilin peptidase [Arsukibacterium sp. UBA3155]|uniref:prepilin peptidase n=1 Tax=Arsukibacterium sp. UBA3155 TaxID=1946058 RepID=UPI0025BCC1BF|nr:A24 family peptidase [Arsukibacterium sp. UBA3155]|tara:strand:- start:98710 stop:99648 length:939 start_codon:yes stop_codon:yes gene_type:complete